MKLPKKVSEPDIKYHSRGEFMNASALKSILESPAHYYYNFVTHKETEEEKSKSLKMGTATHCYLLERHKFDKQYAVILSKDLPFPDKDFRNGDNVKYRKDFLEANAGKIILTESEMHMLEMQYTNCMKIDMIKKLFKRKYEAEKSYYFNIGDEHDLEYHINGKVRADYLNMDLGIMIDVKTSMAALPSRFNRQSGNLDYPLQFAWYYDKLNKYFYNDSIEAFYVLVISNQAPFLSSLMYVPMEELRYGKELYTVAIDRLRISEELGYYPGYEIYAGYDHNEKQIMAQGINSLETKFKKDFIV